MINLRMSDPLNDQYSLFQYLSISLSLSLLHYISQKSTCVNYGISKSNPCNYTLPLVLIVAAQKRKKK